MSLYTYVVNDSQGTVRSGSVSAGDESEARKLLEKFGGVVRELRKEPDAPGLSPSWKPDDLDQHPLPELTMGKQYAPLTDTFRLYAGWLLAWYVSLYALGAYQRLGRLFFRVPYVDDLMDSSLVASAAWAAFLILALTGLHRMLRGGLLLGWLLTIGGAALFVAFTQYA